MRALNKTVGCSNLNLLAGLSLIICLSACGDGGGGSGNGITLPTAPVTITPQNAPQVAGAAVDAAFGGAALPVGVTSASSSAASAAAAANTVARIGRSAALQVISQGATPAVVTGAVTTTNCLISGTMTLSTTSSTSGSTTYSNCSDVAGETMNGTVSLSNIVSTPSSLSTDAVFDLTITTASPANTMTAIGDMHLFIDTMTITMSGTSLSMGNTDSALGNLGLQNYSISFDSLGNFTVMTFTFASTAINGTAVFTMTSPFLYSGGMLPSSGTATISGANSTVLKLTVLGDETAVGSQVQLELSTNGGSTYAAPTNVTWASISSKI